MPTKRKPSGISPNLPLAPKREAFALAIVNGMKLQQAHKAAGYDGKAYASAWQMRHSPDIAARIKWMLEQRVIADSRSFGRRQKKTGDLLARVVAELEDIAFQDVREVVDWRREAVTNEHGEVVDVRETVAVRDSAKLTPQAARSIKGVIVKAGKVQIELHDKRAALEALARILKGDDVATPQTVNVQQINVGTVDAVTAAQRVAFLLAAAASRPASQPMRTIDAAPVHNSKDMDGHDKP